MAFYFVISRPRLGDFVDGADALVLDSICPRDHQRLCIAPSHLSVVMIAAIRSTILCTVHAGLIMYCNKSNNVICHMTRYTKTAIPYDTM